MFKGHIVAQSMGTDGRVHTFRKDFDDYDAYCHYIDQHPEYSDFSLHHTPWSLWNHWLAPVRAEAPALPAVSYLPEGVDLEKYESRRRDQAHARAEIAQKRHSLQKAEAYLKRYLEDTKDEEASEDLKKIQDEIASLGE